jgi:alginate O-acetyltransferase complex protein AlgJ
MQMIYRMSRYVLPVVFFGYAPFANLAYFEEPGGELAPFDMGVLKGTLTASFDHAYKTSMPHRDASIGLIGAARYVLAGEGRKGVIAGKDGWLFTAEEARPLVNDLGPSLDQIAQVRKDLADAGAMLVLVPVPAKMDIHSGKADAPELSTNMSGLYANFIDGLQREGIDVVDTRSALLGMTEAVPAFFATDTHWTLEGAKAVAQSVAASGFVTVGDTEMTVEAQPAKVITGDLVSYVTTDTLAPMIGLAAENVAPYLANAAADADLGDIFGAQSVDVVLIGSSYSANPDWSFSEALKLSLKADVLNAAAQGRGPVQPMVDYLASSAFLETPPKVVIWEFPLRYLTDPALWDGPTDPVELASAD